MFSLSHEESGNHHRSNSVALEGKDKGVTILLEASATGQVVFSKCFYQLVVESSSPLPLCAFCWGSKPGPTVGGWSQGNWSVLTMAKRNSDKEGKRIKILFVNEDIRPYCPEVLHCLNGFTGWHQGALCLGEAVQNFAGFVLLRRLWFCIAAQEMCCSP